ncbi:MAG TPA: DoxX family protein [Candidatus Paceibacterota bacterium]|jgi:uncharacterized membrane protein YphA (DoxX/SURF4 family)|nr:DoxX family protein [Candidatus Paceibacterota bacterium]
MKKILINLETYAPSVLRYGISAVILWFGFQQLLDPTTWIAYIPDSIVSLTHLDASTLVVLNGLFELIFGAALLFGYQVRIVALLIALHLLDIMFTVGYGQIAVRDFGLAIAVFVVFMNGSDILCLQYKKKSDITLTNHI